MALDRCRCGFLFVLPGDREHHRCPPLWEVWCPDRGEKRDDGGRQIYAASSREAAAIWAEQSDRESAEYNIVHGETVVVCVAHGSDEAHEVFVVQGEMVPEYRAEQMQKG